MSGPAVAGLLLASGLSSRFGAADKLVAELDGEPLAFHAARALLAVEVALCFAVTGGTAADFGALGFTIVRNPDPHAGLGRSLALGVQAVRRAGAAAVLIVLADMPSVSSAHLHRLLACHDGPGARAASVHDGLVSPPALFGADWFDKLEALDGDRGARPLLEGAALVPASARELVDVDTREALERLRGGLA